MHTLENDDQPLAVQRTVCEELQVHEVWGLVVPI